MTNHVFSREQLQNEYEQLNDRRYKLTKAEKQRLQDICALLNHCKCRNCGKTYDARKSRADWTGFCSAKCQHEKAKYLGYRAGGSRTAYNVLKAAKCIGDDFCIK